MKDMNALVDRRYDFALLFDVTDGNPNGDPDAGNMPRIDPQTMQGLVTDGCLKRKVRDFVTISHTNNGAADPRYGIYIQIQGVLQAEHERAYLAIGVDPEDKDVKKKAETTNAARKWMCENFFDVRTFGAVMSLKVNCGQVRGPVQLTFARSVDPIIPMEITITRKAVATRDEADKQIEKSAYVTGTMGRKNTVPYGLYRGHGFVSPHLAADTGFTYGDLSVFFDALARMFEFDRSASHGLMATRGIYVFEHDCGLGKAPAHELFARVRTEPLGSASPARRFEDYAANIRVDTDSLPDGVRLFELPRQHDELFAT